jgi:hypothetical protein
MKTKFFPIMAFLASFLVVFSMLALAACAVSPSAPSHLSERERAIQLAKSEIAKRNIKLPFDCDISVVDGVATFVIGKPEPKYLVLFKFKNHGRRDLVYKVVINKRSGRVEDFLDYRDTIPGG